MKLHSCVTLLYHQGKNRFNLLPPHRVLQAGDDVGDAHDDAAGVGPEPGTGLELLLGHAGQKAKLCAPDVRIQFEEPEEDVDSVDDWIIQN